MSKAILRLLVNICADAADGFGWVIRQLSFASVSHSKMKIVFTDIKKYYEKNKQCV